ncbi:MAG: DUF438 domain-containing protein [Coriobacteriia bacterium]|nr:DUF438 domain-containing protein [Coriobacteriia bacterium]MBN2839862.1 DUF438 domain-containing protein [Coriobacteriia bacterium]
MRIGPDTKVHDLLQTYPFLKSWLTGYAPAFEKLANPVVYNTVGRVATLEAAAKMADLDPETLAEAVREQVAMHSIVAEETAGAAPPLDDAERARRQETLKGLIRELHDGASVESVKARFDELARDIDAAEVAMMEQALIAEGMPVTEVQRLCDVHVAVFKESLESGEVLAVAATHPVDAYVRENEVVAEITAALRADLEALAADRSVIARIAEGLARLSEVATHYRRKEMQLFPVLESHGVEGPTKVMWALDDDIIAMIRRDRASAEAGDTDEVAESLGETLQAVDDMVYKEEKILFPTALDVLDEAEWIALASGDAEIGYAWIEAPVLAGASATVLPGTGGAPTLEGAAPTSGQMVADAQLLLTTGALTREQVDLMLSALPFDLSFVDEHDRVRFYSEGERVFPRSPAVIGREVRNCHPPASVHKVEEILTSFRGGEKDTAEFWIQMQGRFLHIRYFAMRDAVGGYRGCLEVVQDATHIRALEGERRIVDW